MAGRKAAGDGQALLAFYRRMMLVRMAEQRLGQLFADGEIPGFIHLSIGQEAVAAGVMAVLGPKDTIASNHRGHGHALAKGVALDKFFLEVLGKEEGICRGRGGSMHVAETAVGMLGANGIVGAGLSIALGSALAHQVKNSGQVAAAFFGDGAVAEGLLHEAINLAQIWRLPLLLVCENNGWAEFTPSAQQVAVKLEALAGAFGVPYRGVDGNDVEAVHAAAEVLVTDMRQGGGPRILECATERVRGHFEGDQQKYRDPAEIAGLGARDPIVRLRRRLQQAKITAEQLSAIEAEIGQAIDQAVALAKAGSPPDFQRAQRDVYTVTQAAEG